MNNALQILRIVNSLLNSNTFAIVINKDCWLVDCGDWEKLLEMMPKVNEVKGVFITHAHFDHIYGLNSLIDVYPGCKVYASEHSIKGLGDSRLNYSRYHESDFEFHGACTPVSGGQKIEIDSNNIVETIPTPGHDEGCVTYKIGKYLFTGDSYIPGVKTVTNLRGNKIQAKTSEDLIKTMVDAGQLIVCPGHGEMTSLEE